MELDCLLSFLEVNKLGLMWNCFVFSFVVVIKIPISSLRSCVSSSSSIYFIDLLTCIFLLLLLQHYRKVESLNCIIAKSIQFGFIQKFAFMKLSYEERSMYIACVWTEQMWWCKVISLLLIGSVRKIERKNIFKFECKCIFTLYALATQ